jgi:hypothetical protein
MLYRELPNIAARVAAVPARIPLSRNVAVEIETQGDRHVQAQMIRQAGLAFPGSRACEYHCDAPHCREGYLVHPTQDCTVTGVEAVVGGVRGTDVSSSELHLAIERLCIIFAETDTRVNRNCGGHIHVDRTDMTYEQACLLIENTTTVEHELRLLMSAQRRGGIRHEERVRSLSVWQRASNGFTAEGWSTHNRYDPRYVASFGERGYWFWFTGYNTVEFRGWNATIRAWRVIMGLYVSAALVQATVDGRRAVGESILDHLGDYLPDYVQHLVRRQFGYLSRDRYYADRQEAPQLEAVSG